MSFNDNPNFWGSEQKNGRAHRIATIRCTGRPSKLEAEVSFVFFGPATPEPNPAEVNNKIFFPQFGTCPDGRQSKNGFGSRIRSLGPGSRFLCFFCFCFGLAWKSLETRVRDANSWSDRSGPFQGPSRVPPGLFGPSKPSTLVAPRSRIHGSGKDGFGLELGQIRPGRPSAGPVPGRRGTMRLMSSDFSGRSKAPTFEGGPETPQKPKLAIRGGVSLGSNSCFQAFSGPPKAPYL